MFEPCKISKDNFIANIKFNGCYNIKILTDYGKYMLFSFNIVPFCPPERQITPLKRIILSRKCANGL